ncbi:MAG: sulfotransferase [Acetobacteraceae bacterium]|nr:sulfotransferase [Acetobacteraceae bacterium]
MPSNSKPNVWSRLEIGLTLRCLLQPGDCFASKLFFLAGCSYLFQPIDLIKRGGPLIGHLDEVGFVLAGLCAARLAARPALARGDIGKRRVLSMRGRNRAPGLAAGFWFRLRVLRADLSNFFLLQYRGVDGFLITGKNSGTHWLKFMLSCAIAEEFGVAAPRRSSGREADAIIGHPRWPAIHAHLPRIASSHTIPSRAFAWRWLAPLLVRQPVVILVRDIRSALTSNYVKWADRYAKPFSAYLIGDPRGRQHVADIWWYIHFMNRWGDVAAARPGQVMILRYEDVIAAPDLWVRKVAAHWRIALSDRALEAAAAFISRDAVQARLDPTHAERIIPQDTAAPLRAWSAKDHRTADAIIGRYLRHDHGYGSPPSIYAGARSRIG